MRCGGLTRGLHGSTTNIHIPRGAFPSPESAMTIRRHGIDEVRSSGLTHSLKIAALALLSLVVFWRGHLSTKFWQVRTIGSSCNAASLVCDDQWKIGHKSTPMSACNGMEDGSEDKRAQVESGNTGMCLWLRSHASRLRTEMEESLHAQGVLDFDFEDEMGIAIGYCTPAFWFNKQLTVVCSFVRRHAVASAWLMSLTCTARLRG
ncbi:hypothetical protein BDW22DRAFT_699715 [Trametopsis cervina]|nr:hypothetical protein BDW22DRAFT_699715 [Trametopsis cervina]